MVNYPFLDFYSTTKIQINISSSLLTRLSKFSCLAFWSIIILFFPVSIGLSSGLQGEEVKGGQGAPGLYLEVKGGRRILWVLIIPTNDPQYTLNSLCLPSVSRVDKPEVVPGKAYIIYIIHFIKPKDL